MDVDNSPAPPLNCFICDDPETPAQKLAQATPKGYPTLLAYAGSVGNATILEPMKEAWNVGRLIYYIECFVQQICQLVSAHVYFVGNNDLQHFLNNSDFLKFA